MSQAQQVRLATIIGNGIKDLAHSPEQRLALGSAVTRGIEKFYAELKSEALEESVDVVQLCREVEKYLAQARALVKELTASLPAPRENGKMAESKGLARTLVVRDGHRIVLSEFSIGTSLLCRQLLRTDDTIGGVELLEMR